MGNTKIIKKPNVSFCDKNVYIHRYIEKLGTRLIPLPLLLLLFLTLSIKLPGGPSS